VFQLLKKVLLQNYRQFEIRKCTMQAFFFFLSDANHLLRTDLSYLNIYRWEENIFSPLSNLQIHGRFFAQFEAVQNKQSIKKINMRTTIMRLGQRFDTMLKD
jgi:hypothetical protein